MNSIKLLTLSLVGVTLLGTLTGCKKDEDEEEQKPTPELGICPDTNHPHMIDLGLPSGTKWCCCNVGASSPAAYGAFFAWGETEIKETFGWANYSHYVNSADAHYIDIGKNIAGTKYDAAHVKLGEGWTMPTVEQIEELHMKYKSKIWTDKNGVKGLLYTGPSGAQIFFPGAGYIETSNNVTYHRNETTQTRLWTSEEYSTGDEVGDNAYYMELSPSTFKKQNTIKCFGLSIRPVHK